MLHGPVVVAVPGIPFRAVLNHHTEGFSYAVLL